MSNQTFNFAVSAYNGKLAGMARPGLFQSLQDDVDMLLENNVRCIITLTDDEWIDDCERKDLFAYKHYAIGNFEAPSMEQISDFCECVDEHLKNGRNVVCHCFMGVGRTGTMLACYRVHLGEEPQTAIENVRNVRAAIENKDQEQVVYDFYNTLVNRDK